RSQESEVEAHHRSTRSSSISEPSSVHAHVPCGDWPDTGQGGGEPSTRGGPPHDGTELADHGNDRQGYWRRRSRADAPCLPARLRELTAGSSPTRSIRRGLAPRPSMARNEGFST